MELISPSSHSVFHAVYVPIEDDAAETKETHFHVYCDKVEALNIIKKYTKGRLKTFRTLEEAQEFARNGLESILPNPLANSLPTIVVTEEKSSNFKSLKPQNLTQFRKVIEYGDIESVKTTIWENPRYLVGNGDTPTILHEGCRYNALHVAVKSTQSSAMCELILNTVGDPEFVKLLYGDIDMTRTYVDRASILQDLYLNTPDKGLNETPLHFAAKYGLKDCVRSLLTYSQCLRTPLNKHEQTPADIVCTRKSMNDQLLINEIRLLLEEQYYVPVLRAEDNSLQPIIGEPFSPSSPLKLNVDPISPRIEVRAFAGPMTKAQALEFRKKWKTPPRILGTPNTKGNGSNDCNGLRSPSLNLSLRLKDTDKGLERVGRELASEYQIAWKEYWPFLKDFTDLQCNEGLEKLEKFLKNMSQQRTKITLLDIVKTCMNHFETPKLKNEINVDEINNMFIHLTLQSQTDSDQEIEDNSEYITPPTSPLCINNNDNVDSSDEDDMDLADDSIKEELFLEGKSPTKIDFAVYSAIPSTIDVIKYPFIYRWRHEMQLASKNINNCLR
ncbi:PREDICTED: ankyrin repeat and LEM domain-containing protein 2 [Ceratosolen solmsi marchali]|uniref:Ankyrin repeat and LEM domain-containing protein 2 n=1 Tax=Ceratosolen solmsi marchali TaxID=326594 RepID=A0AAJ6YPH4_9HYME|nr:PREDICTED: ankyrin repeat and LEM domain-containing protein 2 [Ceratosolen solmsi marchali]